jgi:hypothetical protein
MKFFVLSSITSYHFPICYLLLSISILTYITQLSQADNEVLRIEEEGSFETNLAFTEDKSLRDTIERFATSEQWQQAQDNDFHDFAYLPNFQVPHVQHGCKTSWIMRASDVRITRKPLVKEGGGGLKGSA